METKKEKLKFYRLVTRPSYAGASSPETIGGYVNTYNEFKQYDVEPFNEGFGVYLGPAPKHFFSSQQGNLTNVPFKASYHSLEFIIDGIYEAYDRRIHDLDTFSPKIYILESSKEGIFGRPYNDETQGEAGKKKLVQSIDEGTASITFYINPVHLRAIKRKYFQQLRTRAGWAFQHWGPQIGEIQIEGTTGNISADPGIVFGSVFGLPILPQVVDEIPNEQNSTALAAFRMVEKWYDEDQGEDAQKIGRLTALEYRGRVYVGHFAEFSFEERGTHPFQLFYRIRFLVHYDTTDLNAATDRSRGQIIRNEETIAAIRRLKTGLSETELETGER